VLVVHADVSVRPDRRAEFVTALAGAAKTSRGDAGCRSYAFFSDVEDEHHFTSIETWDDQAALDAHFEQPHTVALLQAAGDAVTAPPTITVYEVAETRQM
jgi:quinol monooxygenase YgiN